MISTLIPDPPAARAATYAAERDRVVLQRYRQVNLAALVLVLAAAAVNCVAFREDRLADHLAVLLVQGLLCVLAVVVTGRPWVQRHGRIAVLIISLLVSLVLFRAIGLTPNGADVMVSSVLTVMAVPALLLPWGLAPQAVLSTFVAGGYLRTVPWHSLPPQRAGDVVISTLLGVFVTTVAAFVLDRHRHAAFVQSERATALLRHQTMLVDVGRRLNATLDLDELRLLVARLANELLGADVATLVLVDAGARTNRLVIVDREKPEPMRAEVPVAEIPGLRELLMHEAVLEVPGPTPVPALEAMARGAGLARLLLVLLQRDGVVLGTLGFGRRALDRPFTEPQHGLAQGLAHQAAIALANATLVRDLQHASRIKSSFLSTMSHELRTPLNVILGFAEMARDDTLPPAEQRDLLARIELAGRDLLELIESTLAIGKLEAGRDAVELERLPLRTLWTDIGEACTRLPCPPGVSLEWGGDVPAVTVETDPRKLRVVLRNLVGNALKFTERGYVRATATIENGVLVLQVADTGIGIRREDQATIFEMFRQADGSDTRRFGGSGLGLYIVDQYVRQLGGSVAVESAPGRGSRFTVTVPRATVPDARDAA